MALEAFTGKIVFLGDPGGICGILEWLEGFGVKDWGPLRVWKFFGVVWSGLGPNRK
jgi:hypothetical protein